MKKELENKLQRLKNEAIEELCSIGLSRLIEVNDITYVLNTRAKRRFGQVRRLGTNKFEINISAHTLQADDVFIKDTIIHEILHTFPNCINHGTVWKQWAKKVNNELGYNIKRTSSVEEAMEARALLEESNYKYRATCQSCGLEVYRMRSSNFTKNPQAYRCRQCTGKFKVEEL